MASALDLSNWMKYLEPSEYVIDSYIPCSHDASAYPYASALDPIHDAAGSICQSGNYTDQLLAGSRYFDMRITRSANLLVMKHNIITFQTFETVLNQIKGFANAHKSEFIFLDLDFNHSDDIASDVLDTLIKILGDGKEDAFATAHVAADGKSYNKALTWAKLKEDGKQFIIIWGEDETVNGDTTHYYCDKLWAPQAADIRDNWSADYEDKSPQEIVDWLDQALKIRKKEKLWITQLIDTPKRSYLPGHHPRDCDSRAAPIFNEWVTHRSTGLGIVKRDFVNEGWNQAGIHYVIRLNKFAQSPDIPLGAEIDYLNSIRLKTLDGRYLAVDIQPPGNGKLSLLTVVDEPSDNTRFLIRERRKNSAWTWPFSGNLDADSCGANGNIRLAHVDSSIGNDTVLSCVKDSGGFLYWGVSWDQADERETFLPYNPADTGSKDVIRHGNIIVCHPNTMAHVLEGGL